MLLKKSSNFTHYFLFILIPVCVIEIFSYFKKNKCDLLYCMLYTDHMLFVWVFSRWFTWLFASTTTITIAATFTKFFSIHVGIYELLELKCYVKGRIIISCVIMTKFLVYAYQIIIYFFGTLLNHNSKVGIHKYF